MFLNVFKILKEFDFKKINKNNNNNDDIDPRTWNFIKSFDIEVNDSLITNETFSTEQLNSTIDDTKCIPNQETANLDNIAS